MRSRWFGLVIAALALALSVWAYARLPESIATQWDAQGVPNGYSPRLWVVAMLPLVILVVTGLFNVTPVIDPRRENYPKFWDTYWLIANAILAFVGVAHVLVIAHGMGYTVPVERLLPLGLGLLLAFLGNYLTRVQPNWFVGVRTPWTLSSDTVWRKTHRTAAWLLVVGGLVIAAAAFTPGMTFVPIMVATVVVVTLVPVVQSYVLWKREQK